MTKKELTTAEIHTLTASATTAKLRARDVIKGADTSAYVVTDQFPRWIAARARDNAVLAIGFNAEEARAEAAQFLVEHDQPPTDVQVFELSDEALRGLMSSAQARPTMPAAQIEAAMFSRLRENMVRMGLLKSMGTGEMVLSAHHIPTFLAAREGDNAILAIAFDHTSALDSARQLIADLGEGSCMIQIHEMTKLDMLGVLSSMVTVKTVRGPSPFSKKGPAS